MPLSNSRSNTANSTSLSTGSDAGPFDRQVTCDDSVGVSPGETLGRLSPQPLTKRPALGGQPAPLRVPHTDGIPPGSSTVGPRDTTL